MPGRIGTPIRLTLADRMWWFGSRGTRSGHGMANPLQGRPPNLLGLERMVGLRSAFSGDRLIRPRARTQASLQSPSVINPYVMAAAKELCSVLVVNVVRLAFTALLAASHVALAARNPVLRNGFIRLRNRSVAALITSKLPGGSNHALVTPVRGTTYHPVGWEGDGGDDSQN